MIARRADVDPAAKAAGLEPRLSLGRAIGAVGEHVRRRVGFVHKAIQLLAIVDCRVAHVIAPDQFVRGSCIHMVLVAVKAPPMPLGPARSLVVLPVFGWLLLPRLGRLASSARTNRPPRNMTFGSEGSGIPSGTSAGGTTS